MIKYHHFKQTKQTVRLSNTFLIVNLILMHANFVHLCHLVIFDSICVIVFVNYFNILSIWLQAHCTKSQSQFLHVAGFDWPTWSVLRLKICIVILQAYNWSFTNLILFVNIINCADLPCLREPPLLCSFIQKLITS